MWMDNDDLDRVEGRMRRRPLVVATWDLSIEEKWLLYAPNGALLNIEIGASTPFGVKYGPVVLSGEIPGPTEDGTFEFGTDSVEDAWPSASDESPGT